jgi:hypothetical protein
MLQCRPLTVLSRFGKADAVRVSGRGATPSRFAITDVASTKKHQLTCIDIS